ncbi:MAG: Na+/H+ antiporter NhaC family protein [Gemmatimonadota bacterium]
MPRSAVALLVVLVLAALSGQTAAKAAGRPPGSAPPQKTARSVPAPTPQDAAQGVSIEAPRIALTGVGFTLSLRRDAAAPPSSFRLLTATGRELARGTLTPGEELALPELHLTGGEETPLSLVLEADGSMLTIEAWVLPGWVSILPPLVAIALALVFREVVISLFFGVWIGAFFFAGLNPITATMRAIDHFALSALADADHAAIIIFSLLLGGMVGVMARGGGTQGIVDAVSPLATSPRRAQLATYLGGLAIFFDDYANTLIVGNTMRPITDRMKVSREKLAYIVDSTAAPVTAIVFVSTWVGFEISLIGDGLASAAHQAGTSPETAAELLSASPFNVFIQTIPYLFYPILALLMVALIIATQRDFGPMWKAENRAGRGDGLHREGAMLMADTSGGAMDPLEGKPRRWYNAAAPVLTVVGVVLLGLYLNGRASHGGPGSLWDIFGAADPYKALLWGSLAGCLVAIALVVGQRLMAARAAIEAWLGGMRAMLLAIVILLLAWSLGDVTETLGTGVYLSGVLQGNVAPELIPVLVFVTAAAMSFATGTSWGTMAILIPLVIPLVVALGGSAGSDVTLDHTLLLGGISSVLAGAIFGDHCSPISDTTVLSSMASACDHVDHVRTQLPYALVVALVGMLAGDVPTAYGMSPVFSYALGGAALFLLLRFVGRKDFDSVQRMASAGEEEGIAPDRVAEKATTGG